MKKILATVLALTMIVGMSIVPAFAAAETAEITSVNGTANVAVYGTYAEGEVTTNDDAVYAVDIEWDTITFTYTTASQVKVWNTSSLSYEIDPSLAGTAVWSGTGTITVKNRSNAGVKVTPSWSAAEGSDVVITFTAEDAITLTTADFEGVSEETLPSDTITVPAPSAGTVAKDATNANLGNVVLTLTAAPTEA